MHHRHTLAAVTAGILLTAGIGATIPAGAANTSAPNRSAPTTPLVVNARWAGHASYDRLVIDVRGAMPPVTVHRVAALHQDGSGRPVPLAGRRFLEIRLSPAAAHDEAGRSVYQGPRLVKLTLPALKGVALTGDFEGVVTLGAAFDTEPVYKTFRLHSPERFVIDVAHPVGCRG
ncbi:MULTISPECIES: AMIN-like domain-containing (lipo)protein [unclassified Streptomyces]|uniref:AMIN-like domain-containing (lipo)protein n=1 Tax=unclassified Streptomyces TaxID=2593676 RepID=UPI00368908A8